MLLLAAPASADVKVDEKGKLVWFGDLRGRWEDDWDSRRGTGEPRAARDRFRIRLRTGLRWSPRERLSFQARLRSGSTRNHQSPHVTLFHLQSNDYGPRGAWVDQLLLRSSWQRGSLTVGKDASPFWKMTDVLFDSDVPYVGAWGVVERKGERSSHATTLASLAVPDGDAHLDFAERGWLVGAQHRWERKLARATLTFAPGLYTFQTAAGDNPVLKDHDWTLLDLPLQVRTGSGRKSWTWGVELLRNLDVEDDGAPGRQGTGWLASVQRGQVKEKGDWQAALIVSQVQAQAAVTYLAQDDSTRWGTTTQGQGSNYQGVELLFAHAFTKRLNVMARCFVMEGVTKQSAADPTVNDGQRFRLDLNWKW